MSEIETIVNDLDGLELHLDNDFFEHLELARAACYGIHDIIAEKKGDLRPCDAAIIALAANDAGRKLNDVRLAVKEAIEKVDWIVKAHRELEEQ